MFAPKTRLQQEAERVLARQRASERALEARLAAAVTSDGPKLVLGKTRSETRSETPNPRRSLGPSDVTNAPENPRRLFMTIRSHQALREKLYGPPKRKWRRKELHTLPDQEERYELEQSLRDRESKYDAFPGYVVQSLRAMCAEVRDPDHGMTPKQWWYWFRAILHGVRHFLHATEAQKKRFLEEELRRHPYVKFVNREAARRFKARPEYSSKAEKAARADTKRDERASWTSEKRADEARKSAVRMARKRERDKAKRAEASNVASPHEEEERAGAVHAEGEAGDQVRPDGPGRGDPEAHARDGAVVDDSRDARARAVWTAEDSLELLRG